MNRRIVGLLLFALVWAVGSAAYSAEVYPAVIFGRQRQACPTGTCRPRQPAQPQAPAQPQNVDPPAFDMPADAQSADSGVPTPALVGGYVVLGVVSGGVGAYRAYKKPKAR